MQKSGTRSLCVGRCGWISTAVCGGLRHRAEPGFVACTWLRPEIGVHYIVVSVRGSEVLDDILSELLAWRVEHRILFEEAILVCELFVILLHFQTAAALGRPNVHVDLVDLYKSVIGSNFSRHAHNLVSVILLLLIRQLNGLKSTSLPCIEGEWTLGNLLLKSQR